MLYLDQDLNVFFTYVYLNELLYFIKIDMTRCVYSTETKAKYVLATYFQIYSNLIYMLSDTSIFYKYFILEN